MATQHYVFLSDTARRERQELLTKVHKRFKTPSSETLLFNASRVSYEPTSPTALPTVSRLGMEVCLRAQSVSTRHGVCICAYAQSISPHRCVCVCVFVCVCAVSQHPLWCACVCCVVWSVLWLAAFLGAHYGPLSSKRPFYTFKPVRSRLGTPGDFTVLSQVSCVKPKGLNPPFVTVQAFLVHCRRRGCTRSLDL